MMALHLSHGEGLISKIMRLEIVRDNLDGVAARIGGFGGN